MGAVISFPITLPPVRNLAWIRRRARRLVRFYGVDRRLAIWDAWVDWIHWQGGLR